jgi:hypothetical protein
MLTVIIMPAATGISASISDGDGTVTIRGTTHGTTLGIIRRGMIHGTIIVRIITAGVMVGIMAGTADTIIIITITIMGITGRITTTTDGATHPPADAIRAEVRHTADEVRRMEAEGVRRPTTGIVRVEVRQAVVDAAAVATELLHRAEAAA